MTCRRNWVHCLVWPAATGSFLCFQPALILGSSPNSPCRPIPHFDATRSRGHRFRLHVLDQTPSFSNAGNISNIQYIVTNPFSFRMCAPDYPKVSFSQYSPGSRDRQDLSEDLYLDLSQSSANITYHCGINTTIGYFELPNYWNNHNAGELLSKWPNKSIYQDGFFTQNSSTDGAQNDLDKPVLGAHKKARRSATSGQGPMMISALAIFGSGTFFDKTASANDSGSPGAQTCRQLHRLFMGLFPLSLTPQQDCTKFHGT